MSAKSDKKAADKAKLNNYNVGLAKSIATKIITAFHVEHQKNRDPETDPYAATMAYAVHQGIVRMIVPAIKQGHLSFDDLFSIGNSINPGLGHAFCALVAHTMGHKVIFSGKFGDEIQQTWDNLTK